jgi:hypothetical protein
MGLLWIDIISNPRSILQDFRLGKKPVCFRNQVAPMSVAVY